MSIRTQEHVSVLVTILAVAVTLNAAAVPAWATGAQPASTAATGCSLDRSVVTTRPDVQVGPTPVTVGIHVVDVTAIDDAAMSFTADVAVNVSWRDSRLSRTALGVSPAACGFGLDDVWNPALEAANMRGTGGDLYFSIDDQGTVAYYIRVYSDFSSRFDLRRFPFDRQTLRLQILSQFGPDEVELHPDERFTGVAPELSLVGWLPDGVSSSTSPYHFAPQGLDLASLTYGVEVERQWSYYAFRFITPLTIIVMMSWVVFWIDPSHIGPQLGLSATAILTVFAYGFSVSSQLPRISYLTRFDLFLIGSSTLVFLALLEATTTATLQGSGRPELAGRMDRLARLGFPAVFLMLVLFAFR